LDSASQCIAGTNVPCGGRRIGGIFGQFLWLREPIETPSVSYSGTRTGKMPASDRFPKTASPENEMVITSAHIPAIVALIAGILILIMPRLLNFIVAIYLIVIGLVGLGLLRWLHM
jgi:Protein of unknown function (DUF3096)